MGADIYIESLRKGCEKKWQEKFREAVKRRDAASSPTAKDEIQKEVEKFYELLYSEGYFRDSYNDTSVFKQLGLSWWRDVGNLLPKKDNHMAVPKMKVLLKMVEERNIPDPLKLDPACFDNKENTPEAWKKYFVEKRQTFIDFLKLAIKKNERIRCSI